MSSRSHDHPSAGRGIRYRSRRWIAGAALAAILASPVTRANATPEAGGSRVLRVTADPNNLPFSNAQGEGFENKLVGLIARDLGAAVEYTWWAQRRGWTRNTLKEGDCDLVPGVPARFERTLTTAPYYRSSYVFVYRRDRGEPIRSLDDPRLHERLIGVQMIGDDFANTPPAHALARRGLVANVRGYTVYGNYAEPNPPARIIDAVLHGDIDVAIVWGPLAGYAARQHPQELVIVPLPERDPLSGQTFSFAIAVGVRKSEPALRDQIDAVLRRRKPEIDALLADFGVPAAEATRTTTQP